MWISKYIDLLVSSAVGTFFLFSGTIKLNDPVGFSYKTEEYLHLLATQRNAYLRLLLPYTLALAVGIATLEVVLGVALLAHWQYFWSLWGLFLLTLFFAGLTLYTATSKRLTSCGCLGDALVLKPWQSFAKSIVLLFLLGVLCWQEQDTPTSLQSHYWVTAVLLLALGLGRHTLRHLPVLDFLPYKTGSDLTKSAPEDDAPSAQFYVWRGDQNATQTLLKRNKLLIITQNPASMASATLQKLYTMLQQLQEEVQPMLITPTGQGQKIAATLALPHYTAHPLLLRDMLRAPWGLMLLNEGVVAGKWHYHDLGNAQKTLKQRGWL